MANPEQKVGVLGAGYIADWHCAALRQVPTARLVAVCDSNAARAAQLAGRHHAPAHYSNLGAMLAGPPLDVIHVLLPPEHHFTAARRILEARVSVLLEKPMCLRPEECLELDELARRQGRAAGVSHNFLFFPIYERLKQDVADGVLGRIDHVAITWNKELGQLRGGPLGGWMFDAPGNIMLEVGPHSVAHFLDLVGKPDRLQVEADNPIELPNGVCFRRRWLVRAFKGAVCCDLRFSFGRGFSEHVIHVRGSAGAATADFERNLYISRRHGPGAEDFDRFDITLRESRELYKQAWVNLLRYGLSKFGLSRQGSAFGTGIARSLQCYYTGLPEPFDRRISAAFGGEVVATCLDIARLAGMEVRQERDPARPRRESRSAAQPTVLVLGGAGFIGQAVVRRLVESGRGVRLLVRDPSNLPKSLQALPLDVVGGDVTRPADLDKALDGIQHAFHLARAQVKTWEEHRRLNIDATKNVAEACLKHKVRRLIYTGTIDSYYSGDPRQVIDERTPLDTRIHRRNLYARAKAESERVLLEMHSAHGLPVVIFRPGIVIGGGGAPFHWGVGMWAADSVCRTWGSGTNLLPTVLVDDVAWAMVKALEVDGVIGESFNLVGEPCLSARQYVEELEKAARTRIEVRPTAAWKFYGIDCFKWVVKCLVRHPDRRRPSYRDWQTRSHQARFDCSKARTVLGWQPTSDRERIIQEGIVKPTEEWLS